MPRISLIVISFILLIYALTGCTPTEETLSSGKTSSSQILKVGITANAPPLIYKRNNQVTGLEAELAKELAEFAGRELRFVEVKWVDLIPALISGKIDIIMSGMSITDLRRMRIEFARPYLVAGQVSLVRRTEYNRFSSGLTDLLKPTVRIGTVTGTTGDYLVQDKIARTGNMRYKDPQQAVAALIAGKIDVFVYDLPMNFYFAALNESKGLAPVPVPLSREFLAWGIRKEDTDLLNTANRFIEAQQQTNQLQTIVQRWIPYYKNIYNQ
ncbi:MAG: transporter substrate-binding domain-containing protein [Desulfobulbaceae bacterium]|nr:transporter substrate-binding domain-containing protein [Desulfobulbaceae bacterium]